MSSSELEAELARQWGEAGFHPPRREFKFCANRKWSLDFCGYPDVTGHSVAVEVEGGTWNGGRHNRGSGFEKDCEKYLAALDHGITVIRVTGKMVKDGRAIAAIGRFLRGSSASPATNCSHSLPKKTTKAGTRRASVASGRGKRKAKR